MPEYPLGGDPRQVPSHWLLVRKAVAEAEKKHGRYLTPPEVAKLHQEATSNDLTPVELRALMRIWPGMQLEFKLERKSG